MLVDTIINNIMKEHGLPEYVARSIYSLAQTISERKAMIDCFVRHKQRAEEK